MENQQVKPIPESTLSAQQTFPTKPSFNPWILSTFVLLILLTLVGTYALSQKQKETSTTPQPTLPSVQPSSTPLPTQNSTAGWETHQLRGLNNKPVSNISYKLPPSASTPACTNSACYYQTTILPNNTSLAIIPVGANQGLLFSWDKLINQIIIKNSLNQQQNIIMGLKAIEASGPNINPTITSDLNLLTEAHDEFRVVLVPISKSLSLEIVHYQNKFWKKQKNFDADAIIFNQILSTFQFLDEE